MTLVHYKPLNEIAFETLLIKLKKKKEEKRKRERNVLPYNRKPTVDTGELMELEITKIIAIIALSKNHKYILN